MCATCPFRQGSKYAYLVPELTHSLTSTSRVCHSTGSNNAINKRTGIPQHLCRGSRDVQLVMLLGQGFLTEATDEAWNEKRRESGFALTVTKDPDPPKRIKGEK